MPEIDHQASGVKDKVELLIALGLYKAKSETIKDRLRKLSSRYKITMSLQELREDLDRKLGEKSLSQAVVKMREEEMH